MKKSIILIFSILILMFLLSSCMFDKKNNDDSNRFNSDSTEIKTNIKQTGEEVIISYNDDFDIENLKSLGFNQYIDLKGMKKLIVKTNYEPKKVKGILENNSVNGVTKIEPNYIYKNEMKAPNLNIEFEDPDLVKSLNNNPLSIYQWALDDEKDKNGNLIPGHFDAENVWKLSTGRDVLVAVIDTGVDGSHPDIRPNIEFAWDTPNSTVTTPDKSKAYHEHGTHVSGIIAGVDNDTGIVGLAKDAKIIAIPYLNVPGGITYGQLAVAIEWAVGKGAKILQNSWGGPGYGQELKDMFDYALENDVSVIVSTGNTHIDENWGFPNTIPGIVGVGASDANGDLAGFSSRGDSVSVIAPGVKILSTVSRGTAGDFEGYAEEPYQFMQGTSMASPYVSALAALLYEKYPNATPYQIRKLMENTASNDGSWNVDDGYGVINPLKALKASLPSEEGANFIVEVTNSFGKGVPAAFVSLKRNGKPSYYAKTDAEGKAKFVQIDPDTYDVIIGGPDYLDLNAPNLRMEEERQITVDDVVVVDGESTQSVQFTSTFEAVITKPQAQGDYTIKLKGTMGEEISTHPITGDSVTITKPATSKFFMEIESTNMPELPAPKLTDDFETGDFSGPTLASTDATVSSWKLGGDVDPVITPILTGQGYSVAFGGKPLKITNLTDEQKSTLSLDLELPEATNGYILNFIYLVSTEEGYDYLTVYVDGEVKFQVSGEKSGDAGVALSAGEHTVVFEYAKDQATSAGYDLAVIDNVSLVKIPDDYEQFNVPVSVNLNGNTISFTHNLYNGSTLDEFETKDAYWTVF
ncbi:MULTISPECIES: S8 family serine peptidase [Oceanotoga]|uniref:S8 family serine peptidase n=1 Tax=Oceanotoga TaxID=1255275 RepID=UPI0026547665|nr:MULTISPECIES: S8 family serine peptidase [Oceanotoga]MDN5341408.1 hypothetical protein [Oceanotoga sp.]MDO7975892.1 S8 family serine peptidase [Oceanotoga teriensis]